METKTGNIALENAISGSGSGMNLRLPSAERFRAEMNYQAAKRVINCILSEGLISSTDYCEIETILRKKFDPISGSLAT